MFSTRFTSFFTTPSDALAYVIMRLDRFSRDLGQSSQDLQVDLQQFIIKLKIVFENHLYNLEQYPCQFAQLIETYTAQMNNRQRTILHELELYLSRIPHMFVTLERRFENITQRRFESELAIQLTMNPTDGMMNSVGKLSEQLIKLIDMNDQALSQQAVDRLSPNEYPNNCYGHQKSIKDAIELKAILRLNDKKDFLQIMLIHFVLWWVIKRYSASHSIRQLDSENKPFGKFNDYSEKRLLVHSRFGNKLSSHAQMLEKIKGELAHLSDSHFMNSALFRDRGRGKDLGSITTCCFGIMLVHQDRSAYREAARKTVSQRWVADVVTCSPNFNSHYVTDILDANGVYVSGASGMTSVFLSLMETIGDFSTLEMKQHYLLSISAYIVTGGYHSFHEVLAPAENILGLVPGYYALTRDPEYFHLLRPANYRCFFELFQKDLQFKINYDESWENLLQDINLKSGFVMKGEREYRHIVLTKGFFKQKQAGDTQALMKQLKQCITSLFKASSIERTDKALLLAIPETCHTFESALNVLMEYWVQHFNRMPNKDKFANKFIAALKNHDALFDYLVGPVSWGVRYFRTESAESLLQNMVARFVSSDQKSILRLRK